jgi:hypothetical protein
VPGGSSVSPASLTNAHGIFLNLKALNSFNNASSLLTLSIIFFSPDASHSSVMLLFAFSASN